MQFPIDLNNVKGFLDPDEGAALYERCLEIAPLGPSLEIGSYCGKSTIWLGTACRESGRTLYAVDHHRGSEEHQLGEEYHDPELYDAGVGKMDSFREFRINIDAAGLADWVVPVVASSETASRDWSTPLGMVFIDGGHSMEAATTDLHCWSRHVVPGGILAIHDLFPDPAEGGQAPITIYRNALESGEYEALPTVRTLGLLRRRQD